MASFDPNPPDVDAVIDFVAGHPSAFVRSIEYCTPTEKAAGEWHRGVLARNLERLIEWRREQEQRGKFH